MNIPYMKVIIYSLTFIAYCFSGYGSTILFNLRDAILSAENIFGNVLKNVIDVAKNFPLNDVFDAAVEEECIFKCPNGAIPKKNKYHVPSSNGCGSLGVGINSEYLPIAEISDCCNAHDICYDTCNKDKDACDIEFRRCLYKYCDKASKNLGETFLKGCKGTAKMMYTSTLTLGCKPYLDSQSKACYCSQEKKFTRGDEF